MTLDDDVLTKASALPVAPGPQPTAAQAHCPFLLPCLRVLAEQLRRCAQLGEALLHTLAEAPDETGGHPMWRLCSPYLGSVARSPPGCLPKPPAPDRKGLSGVAHAGRGRPGHQAKWQAPTSRDAARL